MMTKRFENKVAVITGATSGIGLEIVKRFLAEGAQVQCTYSGLRLLFDSPNDSLHRLVYHGDHALSC